ncbi:MAG: stage III sporulation protein AA [Lachnospiraceae bacterium]|nr:stage III sporulation protein AA [Lachnospiraceae bacterium]
MNERVYKEIIEILPRKIRELLKAIMISNSNCGNLIEVRLRVNKPLICIYESGEYLISERGKNVGEKTNKVVNNVNNLGYGNESLYIVKESDIKELLQYISNYSIYAYEREIRQGYLTIKGGHRIGVAGKVITEGDRIKSMAYITYVNIRIAHEIIGCSNNLIKKIYNEEKNRLYNTVIISPPCCGKTTLLRDLVRNISDGRYFKPLNVGLVDERSEIAACYKGVAQNNIGIRTDVLDCCDKVHGMYMLLRSMSPKVIAVDEIGGENDLKALRTCVSSGCDLIATAHGENISEAKEKNRFLKEILDSGIFDRYIILNNKKGVGNIETVLDIGGNIVV